MAQNERLISIGTAVRELEKELYWTDSTKAAIRNFLHKLPTVDAVEVVHGRWIKDKTVRVMAPGGQKYHNSCSVCGWLTRLHNLNYCPNCGAKMDGGNEDG